MPIELGGGDVLVVVDVQYDFLPGGSLAVAGGDEIIPLINQLAATFTNVVLTQDWHPANHVSFASNHEGRQPFEVIQLPYGPQVLWPDHCIIGSHGAELSSALDVSAAQMIIRKGFREGIDSYSGFQEADRRTPTGLAGYLSDRGMTRVFVVGLAQDYCVSWTAEDAAGAGFETYVIEDATRPINANGSLEAALARMDAAGVTGIRSGEILG